MSDNTKYFRYFDYSIESQIRLVLGQIPIDSKIHNMYFFFDQDLNEPRFWISFEDFLFESG